MYVHTQHHTNKKEILIGHNMAKKSIKVTLLSDALPQWLRHVWAIIRDSVLPVAFKVHILKNQEVSIMLLSCLSILKAITADTFLSE